MKELILQNIVYKYNIILVICYIWLFIRYRKNGLLIFIISLFFSGMFANFGEIVNNIFKIICLLWSIILYVKYSSFVDRNKNIFLILFFIFYIIFFYFISLFFHNDSPVLVFSQSSKYIIPFLLLFVIMNFVRKGTPLEELNKLFKELIFVQIFLNIVKLYYIKEPYEGLVGSLTGIAGGAAGTSFPLLGLLWIAINTKMLIKNKQNWIILGLLFIGFMTGKRAIWLLFPILFVLLGLYVYRRKYGKKIIYTIFLVPLFIYIGLRLIPTLNPENKIWGRFDIKYAYNYGLEYSMGRKSRSDNISKGAGRVGAVALVADQLKNLNSYSKNTFFGYGNEYMIYADSEDYYNKNYYHGIDRRGSITGIIGMYFTIGIIGVILFLMYILSVVFLVENKRLRYIILLLVLFDFIFYVGTILTMQSMFVFLIFQIIYANYKEDNINTNITT